MRTWSLEFGVWVLVRKVWTRENGTYVDQEHELAGDGKQICVEGIKSQLAENET